VATVALFRKPFKGSVEFVAILGPDRVAKIVG
jgi:hypothetical protein